MKLPIVFLLISTLFATVFAQDEAHFIGSSDGLHEIAEGQTARLECRVANLAKASVAESSAVMWLRKVGNDEEPIFVDTDQLNNDARFRLDVDKVAGKWDLLIENVEAYDDGQYVCEISTVARPKITHTLVVKVPPSISLITHQNPLIVRPGDSLDLSCSVSGNPVPEVVWTREDDISQTEVGRGRTLSVPSATVADTGVYSCTAKNSEGQASDELTVKVQSTDEEHATKPSIRAATPYVPVMLNQTVNLTCFYEAQPEPTIVWYHNAFPINMKDGRRAIYQARYSNETEVILSLVNMTTADKGKYMCKASNFMGHDIASISVESTPGPPEVVVEEDSNGHIRVNVQVASPTEVIEYRVKYMPLHDNEDVVIEMFRPNTKSSRGVTTNTPPGEGVWTAEHTLKHTKPKTEYTIETSARNEDGWGPWPEETVSYRTPATPKSKPTKWVPRTGAASTTFISSLLLITIICAMTFVR